MLCPSMSTLPYSGIPSRHTAVKKIIFYRKLREKAFVHATCQIREACIMCMPSVWQLAMPYAPNESAAWRL
jgi:hypothetical protein